MAGGMPFEERRVALEHACRALADVGDELWAAVGADLGPFLTLLDQVALRTDAARVAVLREAVDRGEAGPGRSGAHTWVLDWSPSLRAGGSARVVRAAEAAIDDRYSALLKAVRDARVPLLTAVVVVEEFKRLSHRLAPGAEGPVMEAFVEVASWGRPHDVRGVRQRLIAKYGADGEFQAEQDQLHERRCLSQARDDGGGLFEYTMVVDAEARATIEAAVQGLSAPRPADGEPDRRPSGQRRMDALLEVVRRGVASAEGVATTPKAELFVTVSLHDLVARANAASVFASGESGALLGLGEVVHAQVRWVLTPGSYDHWLAARQPACEVQPSVRSYDVWGRLETAADPPSSPTGDHDPAPHPARHGRGDRHAAGPAEGGYSQWCC